MYSAGKYWPGSCKIFAVCKISADLADTVPGPSGLSSSKQSKTDHSLTSIKVILRSMDKKLNKSQAFLVKESESVYKDISVFLKRDVKVSNMLYNYQRRGTTCCNHVFFAFSVLTNSQQGRMTSVLFASSGEGLCTQFHSAEWRSFVKKFPWYLVE